MPMSDECMADLDCVVASRARAGTGDRPEVLGPSINERGLGTSQRVGAVVLGVEADQAYPGFHDPRILPGGQVGATGRKRNWCDRESAAAIQAPTASRVCSVNSNRTA
jgi:hypothetical protein